MVSNAPRVHETAETLRQRYQADILSLEIDVTDEAQVQSLYQQAAARFGTIDVSIQNAGVITIDYFDRMPKPISKSAGREYNRRLAVLSRSGQIYGQTELRKFDQYLVGPGAPGFIYTRITPPAKWALSALRKAWLMSWRRGTSPSTPSARDYRK